jgi:hypothetical protein
MAERRTNACSHGADRCPWCHDGGAVPAPVLPEERRTWPPLAELMGDDRPAPSGD